MRNFRSTDLSKPYIASSSSYAVVVVYGYPVWSRLTRRGIHWLAIGVVLAPIPIWILHGGRHNTDCIYISRCPRFAIDNTTIFLRFSNISFGDIRLLSRVCWCIEVLSQFRTFL